MTTQMRIRANGSGTLAIYSVDSVAPDDAPFTAPLSHLSRLRFHSGLRMPRIISTTTYSLTLGAYSALSVNRTTYTVAAHGRAGIPLIFGTLPGLGKTMMGTVKVNQTVGVVTIQRFLTLGADASNILLREEAMVNTVAAPALAISLTVYVCDYLLDGSAAPSDGTDDEYISMTPDLIKAQRGAWRSDNRYLRAASSGATLAVPRQATTTLTTSARSTGGVFILNTAVDGNSVAVKTK